MTISSTQLSKRVFFRRRGFAVLAADSIRAGLYAALSAVMGADECVCCGKPSVRLPLCAGCAETQLFAYEPHDGRCNVCGKILVSEHEICMDCRDKTEARALSFCFPVFPYRLWRRELVFAWKSRGVRLFTPLFARIFADVLVNEFHIRETVLVPIPPRPGKIRKKGWDQMEDVSRRLELRYAMPVMRLLKRNSTVQQKKLNSSQRTENARTAFSLTKTAAALAESGEFPKTIILLDDVRTTGTTLEVCASVLAAAGAQDIRAVVLFSVD